MAPKHKRPSPLDDPPSASSSDSESTDHQQQFVMHRQQQQHHQEQEQEDEDETSSEEEQENHDEDQEEDEPLQPSPAVQPPTTSHPKPESESETETETETEPEPEPEPETPKPKPLASKPKHSALPPKSASKRSAETNGHAGDSKRPKKKSAEPAAAASSEETAEEDRKKPGEDDPKKSQRVFSADDEIAILKGLVDFSSKMGTDPFKNTDAFHDFVKKSLRRDTTSNQLKEKIRRLKKKYELNAANGGKAGEGPSFSKPHDQKAFELAKKIWGNNAVVVAQVAPISNGVVADKENNAKANGKSRKTPKKDAVLKQEPAKLEMEPMDLDEAGSGKIDAPLALREFVRFTELGEDIVKERMEWIEASKRQELEKEWSEILLAEFDLRAKRAQLIAEQAKLILGGCASSKH